jgi:hypothetical protein
MEGYLPLPQNYIYAHRFEYFPRHHFLKQVLQGKVTSYQKFHVLVQHTLPTRGYPKYSAKNLLVRYSYCLFCHSITQVTVLKRTVTLFGPIIRLSDSEIHCVNLFHINAHVFANVVFECHDELQVLSNLLPLPSIIGGGMLAYRTSMQQPSLSQHFLNCVGLQNFFTSYLHGVSLP